MAYRCDICDKNNLPDGLILISRVWLVDSGKKRAPSTLRTDKAESPSCDHVYKRRDDTGPRMYQMYQTSPFR